MGMLLDMLKEVPLSAVLKEKLADAEAEIEKLTERVAALEKENVELRSKCQSVTQTSGLREDSVQMLVLMFKDGGRHGLSISQLAGLLNIERSMGQYHMDQLRERKLAKQTGFAVIGKESGWILTPEGRKYAVENSIV